MSLPKTRPLKTVADYLSLDDERRVELIAGDFFVTPSPTCRHQRIVGNVSRALDEHVRARSLGEVYFAPLDVILPSGDVVQPDVLFVSSGRTEIFQDRVRGVPDLIVEVVSDSGAERDRIVKRDLYARNRVAEYWLVDDDARSVEVLTLRGSSYRAVGYFEADEALSSPTFPGLSLPVTRVFE